MGIAVYAPFPMMDDMDRHIGWIPAVQTSDYLIFPEKMVLGPVGKILPGFLQVLLAVVLCVALIVGSRSAQYLRILSFHVVASWGAAAVAGVCGYGVITIERYFSVSLFCMVAVLSLQLSHLCFSGIKVQQGTSLAVLILCSANCFAYFANPPFTQYREMAAFVGRNAVAGEVIIAPVREVLATPFPYYYRKMFERDDTIVFVDTHVLDSSLSTVGVWVVLREGEISKFDELIPAEVRAAFPNLESRLFNRGSVVHMRPANASATR